jgi:hypothetical protein
LPSCAGGSRLTCRTSCALRTGGTMRTNYAFCGIKRSIVSVSNSFIIP